MANLKIFVSSTSYDLGLLRSHLRSFISNFGYDPVMSEYSDVLYNPSQHTHTSCIHEVSNCDCLIVIIGPRFGGTIIPKALTTIDISKAKTSSLSTKLLEDPEKLSITQLEVIKAIEDRIPIFTFIDSKVLHDHNVYEKNKSKPILSEIDFPSIEKKETAIYIFEFINFLRHLTENNSIQPFSRIEDIDSHLRKQWSGLLQRLLFEQRSKLNEERKFDFLTKQIEDIKTAILTTIPSDELKETAKGAIHFRGIIDFLLNFEIPEIEKIILSNKNWDNILVDMGIIDIEQITDSRLSRLSRSQIAFLKADGTFFICRYRIDILENIKLDWEAFHVLPQNRKEAILAAIKDTFTFDTSDFKTVRYINDKFENYKDKPKYEIVEEIKDEKNKPMASHRPQKK
ncbi:DUF4062 domain-containing protein [Flavobacterium sp. H4147]|uniref:DUF4062 domain-containing protein n=1 Tax=Flavobacterium sp. H4147 TaxID=3034149 RepID=UPI0023ECEF79